ncbi:hypothetical protein BOTBODRAFT_434462 [Botryobasidium botryosum FD-172 SS1]|uniref:Uncharacterized protein n=1 Tax=Botryobasidium botryosum (strain FD-172 SS1) TaxID=930990 RepID=A0A067MU80_BOTB1|nr:hypothetical protein BOTBODRAFT_434462 [Botryobasidium botryosum FD-172 SS1]
MLRSHPPSTRCWKTSLPTLFLSLRRPTWLPSVKHSRCQGTRTIMTSLPNPISTYPSPTPNPPQTPRPLRMASRLS